MIDALKDEWSVRDSSTRTDYSHVPDLSHVLPRVLIVSRRTVRKNKFVDFVGEYHLDLIVKYGAVPVIVPRVMGLQSLLDSFEPVHGVLLCEGEDIDPSLYDSDVTSLSTEELEEVKAIHASDVTIDHAKDSIELQLARRCLERNIPYLGICRGSQVLNVACGGSLYTDVETQLSRQKTSTVKHIDYSNYDGHRHPITVLKGTPLHEWFQNSLQKTVHTDELMVNSYHHQGVKRLSARFKTMAYAPDGLIEAFYDPDTYDPENGKFIVGLQFHPERMRHDQDISKGEAFDGSSEQIFDYPECPRAYQEFARAVLSYQRRLQNQDSVRETITTTTNSSNNNNVEESQKLETLKRQTLDKELEGQRQAIVRSFCLAKQVYDEQIHLKKSSSTHGGNAAISLLKRTESEKELTKGADFLQENTPLGSGLVRRLKAMGATVRNSSLALMQLQQKGQGQERNGWTEGEELVGLTEEELKEVMKYHQTMADLAKQMLESNFSVKTRRV